LIYSPASVSPSHMPLGGFCTHAGISTAGGKHHTTCCRTLAGLLSPINPSSRVVKSRQEEKQLGFQARRQCGAARFCSCGTRPLSCRCCSTPCWTSWPRSRSAPSSSSSTTPSPPREPLSPAAAHAQANAFIHRRCRHSGLGCGVAGDHERSAASLQMMCAITAVPRLSKQHVVCRLGCLQMSAAHCVRQ